IDTPDDVMTAIPLSGAALPFDTDLDNVAKNFIMPGSTSSFQDYSGWWDGLQVGDQQTGAATPQTQLRSDYSSKFTNIFPFSVAINQHSSWVLGTGQQAQLGRASLASI